MSLGIGAVAVVDDAAFFFLGDAHAALRYCTDASRRGARCGVHWGMCLIRNDDVIGPTVEVARRLASMAHPGEVVGSCAVLRRAGDDFRADELGLVDMSGTHPLAVAHITQ